MLQNHPPSREIPFVGGPLNGQMTTKQAQTLHPDGSTAPTNAVSLNDWSAYHAFTWIRSTRDLPRWRYYARVNIGRDQTSPIRVRSGLVYLWAPLWCHRQMLDLIYRDPVTFELEWARAVRERGLGHVQQRYAAIMGSVR